MKESRKKQISIENILLKATIINNFKKKFKKLNNKQCL